MKTILIGLIILTTTSSAETTTYVDPIWDGESLADRINPDAPVLQYTCWARGKNTLSQKGGKPYVAEAAFHITERKTVDDLRVIAVEGYFKFAPKSWKHADKDDEGYNIKIEHIEENPYYRPKRYKNYSQFHNFDFFGDMWGDLLISKATHKEKFFAHYLFQQGDHMGGTLHLSCVKN